jgi:hypothetical protein
MNGLTRGPTGPDDDRLDPELAGLFEGACQPLAAETFVVTVFENMRKARRRRLISQVSGMAIVLAAGACVAPYAAEQTLRIAGWVAEGLPANTGEIALASPLGWLCAALVTWRILRHRFQ